MFSKIPFRYFLFSFSVFFLACSNTVSDPADLEPFPSKGGNAGTSENDSSASVTLDSIGMDWKHIPAGTLTRGSSEIQISEFYISRTEITQKIYAAFQALPEQKVENDSLPVTNVSWFDAALFCNALSKAYGLDTAYVYSEISGTGTLEDLEFKDSVLAIRLPTEAEWERAYRAENYSAYYFDIDDVFSYANFSSTGLKNVASFLPNNFGLFDMAGNASEWVHDWYALYSEEKHQENPYGKTDGTFKVYRGGSFNSSTKELSATERKYAKPSEKSADRGFRVVRFTGYKAD